MDPRNFFAELKRRNVYKVAVAYAIVGWLLVQIATQVFPFLDIPIWVVRLVIALVAIGFPIALVIAWAFELTPEGIKRTDDVDPGQKHFHGGAWIYIVLVGAALSIGIFFLGRYTAPKLKNGAVEKSIAVLPFQSLSEDKANAYFAEGIQDEILARLSKIADLKVISRTSTQKYKTAPENLREVAEQLGVGTVLEGSVQKAADQVRVTVQLINALTDTHLWGETYDRKLVDLFQVESDIAQKIASMLEAKLTGREKQEIAAGGTKNPQAYEAYLQALALTREQNEESQERLLDLSRRAVKLDPNFLQAWALLALAESQQYFFPDHSHAQLARAREAAETTARLSPNSSEAHAAMGIFYYYCLRDYDRALEELNLFKEAAPNDATARLFIGLTQRRQGKVEESISSLLAAANLDPLNQDIWANLGRSYRGLRRFDEAQAMFDRALAISVNDAEIIGHKSETYLAQGDLNTAWSIIKDVKFGPLDRGAGLMVTLLIFQRRFDQAASLLSQGTATPTTPESLFIAAGNATLADVYQLKGERDKAEPLYTESARILKTLRSQGDNGLLVLDNMINVTANVGDRDEVEKIATEIRQQIAKDKWGLAREEEAIARAYTTLGDFDRALPLLQNALSIPGSESLTPALLRLDPFWDPVRRDPRFQKLANAQP
jgi:TolB-like protein